MISLDAATVLLQWSAGGLFFLWFTGRRREVGLGYGWLLRGVFAAIALLGVALAAGFGTVWLREVSGVAVASAAIGALVMSVQRKAAGVSGQREEFDRRSERVAQMTGIERSVTLHQGTGPEFSPIVDLLAPALAVPGLVAAGLDAAAGSGNPLVSVLRVLVGALFLGAVTDAMLLGHWYLTQPGLPRRHLNDLVTALGWLWPLEVLVMVLPTGMVAVLRGEVSDGWNGTLGHMWVACAIGTLVLVFVTRAALKERYYSAVMAATGLLYLAILTAFGTDLVARAVLDG
jgi:hypothetical protein